MGKFANPLKYALIYRYTKKVKAQNLVANYMTKQMQS